MDLVTCRLLISRAILMICVERIARALVGALSFSDLIFPSILWRKDECTGGRRNLDPFSLYGG